LVSFFFFAIPNLPLLLRSILRSVERQRLRFFGPVIRPIFSERFRLGIDVPTGPRY
jgi:hypothetical protein